MKIKILLFTLIIFFTQVCFATTINENSYLVLDKKSNTVLIEKNANTKVYPASTTKILTCILALENLNLDTDVTITKEMLAEVPKGSSTMKLVVGDKLKVKDLVYGLMLPSGNDSAVVLSHLISGDSDSFIKLMNEKLIMLDCKNSHFTNPHGFHNDDHYTTASDMAKIFTYALNNKTFVEILSTKSYTIKANNIVNHDRTYKSTNNLLYTSNYSIIGKTGYTSESGNVFVSYASKDNYELIVVLLDGNKNYYNNAFRFEDTLSIHNHIFKNFTEKKLLDSNLLKLQVIDKNLDIETIYTNSNDITSLANNSSCIVKYSLNDILENTNYVTTVNLYGKNFYSNEIKLNLNKYSENAIQNEFNNEIFHIILLIVLDLFLLLIMLICIYLIYSLTKPKKKRKIKKKYY